MAERQLLTGEKLDWWLERCGWGEDPDPPKLSRAQIKELTESDVECTSCHERMPARRRLEVGIEFCKRCNVDQLPGPVEAAEARRKGRHVWDLN